MINNFRISKIIEKEIKFKLKVRIKYRIATTQINNR